MLFWTAVVSVVVAFTTPLSAKPENKQTNTTSIRLAGSRHGNQGRVEILINGTWGTVCSNNWSMKDASVVCRMLGLSNATLALNDAAFTPGTGPVWLDNVRCQGTERSLLDCTHSGLETSNCKHDKDASVVCGNPVDDVLLVDGASPSQGRVEVLLDGKLGSVFDNTWDIQDARVVCRMLGLAPASHAVSGAFFGMENRRKVVIGSVRCYGNETSLFHCLYKKQDEDYLEGRQAGVVCGQPTVKVQLVGGRSPNEGQVEIAFASSFHGPRRKQWTLLCDENWTIQDARVVCRMLGYRDASFAVYDDMFDDGSGMYILLRDIECHGNETSIVDCKYTGLKFHNVCPLVGVICGPMNVTVPLRLKGGASPNSGGVELSIAGIWGSVCQTKWTLANARVVCRLLGLPDAYMATAGSIFGQGSGRIILDNVQCNGSESSLLECRHGGIGITKCNHQQEAGVFCGPPQVEIRLVGTGSTMNQGRVEMTIGGVNGTICTTGWDTADARVLCRMLGRGDTGYPVTNTAFGSGSGAILLRNVRCRGNETNLLSCGHDVIGLASGCNHGTDAGVICGEVKVRLVDGLTWNHGRVEVQIDGVWGRVCGRYSEHDARIVCKMLGISDMGYDVHDLVYGQATGLPNLVNNVDCYERRSAHTILECKYEYRECTGKDVRVACGPPSANMSITNWTASPWNGPHSRPEYALDNDKTTCYVSLQQANPTFNISLHKDIFIHSVSVSLHMKYRDSRLLIIVEPSLDGDTPAVCSTGSRFLTNSGKTYTCDPPIRGRHVIIRAPGVNQNLALCNVDVFTFESISESFGSLQEYWNRAIYKTQGKLLKYQPYFASNDITAVFVVSHFSIVENTLSSTGMGQRISAFLKIPWSSHQPYKFLASCDDECELWLKRVSEEGLQRDVTTADYIIKSRRKTSLNEFNKYPEQTSEPLSLSPCHMYYLEGYLKRYGVSFMAVRIKSSSDHEPKELPSDHIFWMIPGKRSLHFNLQNDNNGRIQADLGSTILISASYRFCCRGVYCPNCSLALNLHVADMVIVVNSSLSMSCQTLVFRKSLSTTLQPGNYPMKISYNFNEDVIQWRRERSVGILGISVSTIMECNFMNGLCPGWTTRAEPQQSAWVIDNSVSAISSKARPLYMNQTGTSQLELSSLPWKPSYKTIKLCLEFEFMLPSNITARLQVHVVKPGNTSTIWTLHGYHGNLWRQGRAPWFTTKSTKTVEFNGTVLVNEDISIAIRDVRISTKSCTWSPVIAKPYHSCDANQFTCANGECVTMTSRCNGLRDACIDGSDEQNCKCLSHQFQCFNGKCVETSSLCDGIYDCPDGFDEKNCHKTCNKFACPDGGCVEWSAVCPRHAHCSYDEKCGTCPVTDIECEVQAQNNITTSTTCATGTGQCGFENGMCNLERVSNNVQSWRRSVAKYSPIRDRIPTDHTTLDQNGTYLYLMTPHSSANKAQLHSNSIQPGQPFCLQFWYILSGSQTASLGIHIKANDTKSLVWRLSEETQDKWTFAQIALHENVTYQVVIEGVVSGKNGLIALDDFNIMPRNCSTVLNQDNPGCSFSTDTCTWQGHPDWKVFHSSSQDHSNSYLFLSGGNNTERTISSRLFNSHMDGWSCFSFWFSSTRQLYERSIEIRLDYENGSEFTTLWSYPAIVKSWTYVQLPLPDVNANLTVSLRVQKSQMQPKITFKKASFSKETCETITPIPECHQHQILDSVERRVASPGGVNCDDYLDSYTWYRVDGPAGNQLPSYCVPLNHCGAKYSGQVKGRHPTKEFDITRAIHCTHYHSCCQGTSYVDIRHCGAFYVYRGIAMLKDFCPAQNCGIYKEVVPVYDKSSEWKSWKKSNTSHEWRVLSNKKLSNLTASFSADSQGTISNSLSEGFELRMSNGSRVEARVTSRVELEELTICFWIKASNASFTAYFNSSRVGSNFGFKVSKKRLEFIVASDNRTIDSNVLNNTWYHVCLTWKSSWGVWYVFQNGGIIGKGQKLGDLKKIAGKGVMTLTHRAALDPSDGVIDLRSIMKISNFNIWSHVIPGEEIVHMSYGCRLVKGDLIAWHVYLNESQHHGVVTYAPITCLGESGSTLAITNTMSNTTLIASIQSPWTNRSSETNGQCLQFKYKIHGLVANTLAIYQTLQHPGLSERHIWIDDVDGDDVWQIGRVWIPTVSSYTLTIEGHLRKYGYMAIAGMYRTPGYCSISPSRAMKACSKHLTDSTGYIVSPNYPGYYPAFTTCTWHVTVDIDHVIRLEFKAFDLEDDSRCSTHLLDVFDGTESTSPRVGRYCGSRYPQIIVSSSHTMRLVFTSKQTTANHGFRIHYDAVKDEKEDCIRGCPSECTCHRSGGGVVVRATNLFAIPKRLPKRTAVVLFANSKIYELQVEDFSRLPKLKYVDLSWNNILRVEEKTFVRTRDITVLKLNRNFLKTLHPVVFSELRKLETLNLGQNFLSDIQERFHHLENLKILNLRSNMIRRLDANDLQSNNNLTHLYLQENNIESIPDNFFRRQKGLRILYLNNNSITELTTSTFQGLSSLEILYLQNNKLIESKVSQNAFSDLRQLRQLKLDSFVLCCYAKQAIKNLECDSPGNEFSSCEDLMKNATLQVFVWIMGLFALIGNAFVIIYWNYVAAVERGERGQKARVQSFLLTNLAVSDFLMGVYLLVIAVQNERWKGEYFKHDVQWRAGIACQIAGGLSMLASEVSVVMLATITADRLNSIVFHIHARPLGIKAVRVICIIIWLFAITISFLPMFNIPYFYDKGTLFTFYGRSAVCLPLQLSASKPAGWEYAVAVFIGFNGLAFLFVLSAYIAIFIKVKLSSRAVRSNMKKDSSLAVRVALIILTDFCCWMPIVVIGLLALQNKFYDPEGTAYAWIAVFVLPVNSSINPILYTFSHPQVRKLMAFWKWHKKTKGKNAARQPREYNGNSIFPQTGQTGLPDTHVITSPTNLRMNVRAISPLRPPASRSKKGKPQGYDTRL